MEQGKWYHLALRWDGTTRSIVINGEQVEKDEQKEEAKEPEPAAWMPPVEDDWMAARRRKVAQRRVEEEEVLREQSGAGSQACQAQVERAQDTFYVA